MFPSDLNEWHYELVRKLVEEGYLEADKFDFKLDLPHKSDAAGKDNLEQTVCAFANTEGGFLIYGVSDDKGLKAEKRIVGINSSIDFFKLFGDKIRGASPSIYFNPKNPAIQIPGNSNVIHVISIPKSSERPHLASTGRFYRRTNKGNELMDYQIVKESFLNYESRKRKIQLLYFELCSIREIGLGIRQGLQFPNSYPLLTIDASLLQTLLADAHDLLDNTQMELLITIRHQMNIVETRLKQIHAAALVPTSDRAALVASHCGTLSGVIELLLNWVGNCITNLESKFDFIQKVPSPLNLAGATGNINL